MGRVAKKFAVPLNVSVSKPTFDRANKLQLQWDALSLEKLGKRVRMSDLAEIIWDAGLRVLEQFDEKSILDAVQRIKEGKGIGPFQFRVSLERKPESS